MLDGPASPPATPPLPLPLPLPAYDALTPNPCPDAGTTSSLAMPTMPLA